MIAGALAVDMGARTIQGIALPYGRTARLGGRHFRFLPGWWTTTGRIPVLRDHNNALRAGRAIHLAEDPERGLYTVLKLGRSRLADQLLAEAAAGVLGMSVGYVREKTHTDRREPGIHLVDSAVLVEITLTDNPAFKEPSCPLRL